MKLKCSTAVTGAAILGLLAAASAFAATKSVLNTRADHTLSHFYAMSPMNHELAHKAAGILVFSRVSKGGAGVAGEFGEGVLRSEGHTVGYYSVGSASVGLTLGFARHAEVIMFMTKEALDKFQNSDGWSIGADTAIAVISTGAGGKYDSASLDKPILGFVFAEKGLIGDVSLAGSKISRIKKDE